MSSVMRDVSELNMLNLIACRAAEPVRIPSAQSACRASENSQLDDSELDLADEEFEQNVMECDLQEQFQGKEAIDPDPVSLGKIRRSTIGPAATGVSRPLHRLKLVREQQGLSQRTVARRLGMSTKAYVHLEDSGSDITVTQLLALKDVLEVPLIDLLEDCESLSRPVAERAKMVKVMKTAVALRELKAPPRVSRMANMLCEQLVEVMPELAEVSGWPQYGTRRGQSAMSKALSQPIDTSSFTIPD